MLERGKKEKDIDSIRLGLDDAVDCRLIHATSVRSVCIKHTRSFFSSVPQDLRVQFGKLGEDKTFELGRFGAYRI